MKPLLFKTRSHREPAASQAMAGDDTLGRGMDMALAVLLFVFLGWLLDRWLGTTPLFVIVLAVLAMVGSAARIKYQYDETMRRLEQQRLESARAPATGNAIEGGR